MWTVEKLTAECQKLSDKFNDKFDIPVTINGRLTTTLGRCRAMRVNSEDILPCEIQFSKRFLENSSDVDIIGVIQHEWAHYYATKSTKAPHGHDSYFKEICAKIGCQNDQRQFKGIAPDSEQKFKYEVYCGDCGKLVATYDRMCPTLKNIRSCRCGLCNGKALYYKQNW
jgi:predicted SprT family Zn-dependent metalloprotease